MQIVRNLLEVAGLEPFDFCILVEPGELFAGVAPGVGLYLTDGFVEGNEAVEVGEEFFVTHGVEGIEPAQGIDPAGFFEKSLLHHLQYAPVDAVVEFFTRTVDANLHHPEGTLLARVGAES